MPRIDPLQLLKCLSVLLTPDGGILSREEVPRLVNLMTKFSKKLVSKCVYVLILKNTETELVDMFMSEGGWALIQTWLQDAVHTSNWDLVREILGLLLVTPVDVERLKLNILPKLIKSLSRREELEGVAQLSTQLVQQWLTIVKGSSASHQAHVATEKAENKELTTENESVKSEIPNVKEQTDGLQEDNPSEGINTNSFYRTTGKDGKLVIRRLSNETDKQEGIIAADPSEESVQVDKSEEEKKEDKNRSSSTNSSKKSRSSSSNREKDRDRHGRDKDRDGRDKDRDGRDKDRDGRNKDRKKSSSSSRHTSSSSSKSRSSSSSKDKKDRDKERDTDSKRNNGALKTNSSSSSSNKDKKDGKDKEKQAEKDKDTLAKIKPPTIDKLGRIPKKVVHTPPPEEKKDLKKKFSVGIRKDNEERPKTVKVFNSKMRSTGLEEEVKPAPPRSTKKPTPSLQLPTIPMKRPSPPKEHREPVVPPEKKLKIDKLDVPERPGAIKLIPPKPKPAMLQESDLFMDALTAATTKKEPKKRKRRPSVSKDATASPTASPARDATQTPTSPQTNAGSSPLGLKNIAPINFYQDTLSEEDAGNKEDNKENSISEKVEVNSADIQEPKETSSSPQEIPKTPTDDKNEEEGADPKRFRLDGELKGVLLYTKKKGPKKSISWRNESDLVEIRYFELDETERVNVTKTFGDMARMEMTSEREAIQLSRKIVGEDLMESQIVWRLPYELELEDPPAIPGFKSLEKDIQFAREKSVLQALYFDKRRIPESPEEPPLENHQMSDPVIIPLDDPDSQEIDLKSTPWPEPKGMTPISEPQLPPQIFPNMPTQFTPQFNNMPPPSFQGMPPRYPLPGGPVGPPGHFGPPNMMPNGNMMGPPNMPPPGEMVNMNSNMYPPGGPMSDGYGPGPGPGPDFPMFNPNMANNMNMYPPKNFNNHRNNRGGGFRRGGGNNGGNWVRMSGGNNWKRGGGGGHRGGRLCKNVQNHGFCRNRDNCPFVHP